MINQECKVICEVLKYSLWGIPPQKEVYEGVDFNKVYHEMIEQRVDVLAADVWEIFDKTMQYRLLTPAVQCISKWHCLMNAQDNLIKLFGINNIPLVVIKGAAVNIYYPKPEYRRMGDIDIIVKPIDFEKAFRIMIENDYSVIDDKDERHIELMKDGVFFELHRKYVVPKDIEIRYQLDQAIFSKIDSAEIRLLGNHEFPTLPKLENGLTLLYHICQHLETGLGLRQIIDWMLFVNTEISDVYWDMQFGAAAKKMGLEKLAIIVTRMCQIYLGLDKRITWCQNADENLCESLMLFLMEAGNFGNKWSKAEKTMMRSGNPISFFRLLQTYGKMNWTLAQKYPLLSYFAWLYQLIRYLSHMVTKQVSFKQAVDDMVKAQKKNNLLNSLEVRRRFAYKGTI